MRTLSVRSLLAAGVLVLAAAHFLPPSSGSQAQAWLDEPPGTEPDSESATDVETGEQTPAPPGQLHPGLVAALTAAQQAAAAEGFDLVVTSGYRTPERQQELLDEEIAERGSYEEASRWVFPPDRSMHVQGPGGRRRRRPGGRLARRQRRRLGPLPDPRLGVVALRVARAVGGGRQLPGARRRRRRRPEHVAPRSCKGRQP